MLELGKGGYNCSERRLRREKEASAIGESACDIGRETRPEGWLESHVDSWLTSISERARNTRERDGYNEQTGQKMQTVAWKESIQEETRAENNEY